jgi:hypothetical protein
MMNKKNKKMDKNHYVDSDELEACWAHWLDTQDNGSWEKLQGMVYKICKGVTVHFNPKSEEEFMELCHETFVLTIEKIKSKKLVFEPGRAPVFNLLTTTIFRHLYSLKNKDNRRRKLLKTKYVLKPGILDKMVSAAGVDGNTGDRHPDSNRIKSSLLAQIDELNSESIRPPE